jgi:hypothetical protein
MGIHVNMRHDVHRALAHHLRVPIEAIRDEQRLHADLGLGAIDLVAIALRLEAEEPSHRQFPIVLLEHTQTVADLAELYWSWSERPTLL